MSLIQVYVTSDRAPEKVLLYALYWQEALNLACLVLGREIQESLIFEYYISLLTSL